MNARLICILTLSLILTACFPANVASTPTQANESVRLEATDTPTVTPTKIIIRPADLMMPTRTPKPTPTLRPSPEAYEHYLPLKWPVVPISSEQLASVKNCDLEKLALQRYPARLQTEDFFASFGPWSDCDWAVLATAYAQRFDRNEPIPDFAKRTFAQVLIRNPGFIFATDLFYSGYVDAMPLVEAPAFSKQLITAVDIRYDWSGMGEPVAYSIKIRQADTAPKVTISAIAGITNTNLSPKIDKQLVQALGPALTDLLPVSSPITIEACSDNYPNWSISLKFTDGTTLALKTNKSNYLSVGGPWQTNIDGQNYLQYSSTLARALIDLVKGLHLSFGQPMAMTCFSEDVLDKAFP